MSPEQRCAAAQYGSQHLQVQPSQPRLAADRECGAGVANEIGPLDRGPFHGGRSGCGFANELRQLVEWIDQGFQVPIGEMDISNCLFQVVMTEEFLDSADIRSRIV